MRREFVRIAAVGLCLSTAVPGPGSRACLSGRQVPSQNWVCSSQDTRRETLDLTYNEQALALPALGFERLRSHTPVTLAGLLRDDPTFTDSDTDLQAGDWPLPDETTIVEATRGDRTSLINFRKNAFVREVDPKKFRETARTAEAFVRWIDDIEKGWIDGSVMLAKQGREIIGYGLAYKGNPSVVAQLAVRRDQKFRRKGIGKALFAKTLQGLLLADRRISQVLASDSSQKGESGKLMSHFRFRPTRNDLYKLFLLPGEREAYIRYLEQPRKIDFDTWKKSEDARQNGLSPAPSIAPSPGDALLREAS